MAPADGTGAFLDTRESEGLRKRAALLLGLGRRRVRTLCRKALGRPSLLPDGDAFLTAGEAFWRAVAVDRARVGRELCGRYPEVPAAYVEQALDGMIAEHPKNPLAPLYLESDLGAPRRQEALLRELKAQGHAVEGARCLDIGCSSGALLLAAHRAGARSVRGLDVSPTRIASARQLCEGTGIELEVRDLLVEEFPVGTQHFEAIFCTDLLEHVPSGEALLQAIKRWLAPGPGAFAFVSVFNAAHESCVRKEPHYGVPGLVLLPYAEARELWLEVRKSQNSNLDYEVFRWYAYREVEAMARRAGLRIVPMVDVRKARREQQTVWPRHAERLDALARAVEGDIQALPATEAAKGRLHEAVAAYCARTREAHERFTARLAPSLEEVIEFHLEHYAQPLRVLLLHA